MRLIRSIVIISDLHVGAGPLDDFDEEIEAHLVAFLAALEQRSEAVELVINGDFIEFVQAEPWRGRELRARDVDGHPLCVTEDQSLRKLASVASAHASVFSALGRFLEARDGNVLTILPGNHDADFFFPGVRRALRALIGAGHEAPVRDRVQFALDRVYRPEAAPTLWIEHGHQYDRCNSFFIEGVECWSEAAPPILPDRDGVPRLLECVGTRFLNKYLNELDSHYPFVDNVKPFSRFLRLFAKSAFHPDFGVAPVALATWAMLRFLASTSAGHPSDLLGLSDIDMPVAELVARSLSRLDDDGRAAIARVVRTGLGGGSLPLDALLANPRTADDVLHALSEDLRSAWSLPVRQPGLLGFGSTPGTLTLARGYVADESEVLRQAARAILDGGSASVVFGHTHEPRDHPDGIPYVNTGSWIRQLDARIVEAEDWQLLRADAVGRFPYALRYVEVHPSAPQLPKLQLWKGEGE